MRSQIRVPTQYTTPLMPLICCKCLLCEGEVAFSATRYILVLLSALLLISIIISIITYQYCYQHHYLSVLLSASILISIIINN